MAGRAHSIEAPSRRTPLRLAVAARARLKHPHLVPVRVVGGAEGHPRLAHAAPKAPTLAAAMARGPLKPASAVSVAVGVARAVDALEAQELVPRDLVPGRVFMIRGRGAALADYGIPPSVAPLRRPDPDPDLAFRSPEERAGEELTPRSSVYSLGALLLASLTGAPPSDSPRPLPDTVKRDVPRTLGAVVARAMATAPERRYATAAELARAAVLAVKSDARAAAARAQPAQPPVAREHQAAKTAKPPKTAKAAKSATTAKSAKPAKTAKRPEQTRQPDQRVPAREDRSRVSLPRPSVRLSLPKMRGRVSLPQMRGRVTLPKMRGRVSLPRPGGSMAFPRPRVPVSVVRLRGRVSSLPRPSGRLSLPRLRDRAWIARLRGVSLPRLGARLSLPVRPVLLGSVLAAVGVAVVAAAGLLSGGGGSPGRPVTLSDGTVSLTLPAGWTRTDAKLDGFGPLSAQTAGSDGSGTSLVAAVMREPSATTSALARMSPAGTPRSTRTRLGRLEVTRYEGLRQRDGARSTAYVLDTSGPSILLTCTAGGDAARSAMRVCAQAAATARPEHVTPITPAAAAARLPATVGAMRRLGAARVEARARLASATYAASQADAAGDLKLIFYDASRRVDATGLPGDRAARLVGRLYAAGSAYGALSKAILAGDEDAYNMARADVVSREAAVWETLPPAASVSDQP